MDNITICDAPETTIVYCGLNTSWSTLKDQCRCVMPVCARRHERAKTTLKSRKDVLYGCVVITGDKLFPMGERCWSVLSNSPAFY